MNPVLKDQGRKSQAAEIDALMEYIEGGGGIALEIENTLEGLPESYSVILETQSEKYDLLIANLIKVFTKRGIPGIFVTVNKSAPEIMQLLEKKGVATTGIFVVDVISKKKTEARVKSKSISYVDSPQNLTEIEAQVTDFAERLQGNEKFFVLDSLSTLLVYNADKNVEKFVHGLGERLKDLGFKAVFTIMAGTTPEIMNVLMQFCDKLVKTSPPIKP